MRILFIGDIYGRSGRDALKKHLPDLQKKLEPDVVIVNGENAAHGIGINKKICDEFFALGVDVITTGNHVWDQREVISYIDKQPKLLRPINFPKETIGQGYYIHQIQDGRKILVINAMGQLFMEALDNPFHAVQDLVARHPMGGNQVQAIFLDFHAEATSEKMAMGHFLDGKVSAVVGTHTHVPTADSHILEHGTAYQTDAGMSGDYNSVIGVRKDIPVSRFVRKVPGEKKIPAEGEGTLCGTFIVSDDATGMAQSIEPVRVGGRLKVCVPD